MAVKCGKEIYLGFYLFVLISQQNWLITSWLLGVNILHQIDHSECHEFSLSGHKMLVTQLVACGQYFVTSSLCSGSMVGKNFYTPVNHKFAHLFNSWQSCPLF